MSSLEDSFDATTVLNELFPGTNVESHLTDTNLSFQEVDLDELLVALHDSSPTHGESENELRAGQIELNDPLDVETDFVDYLLGHYSSENTENHNKHNKPNLSKSSQQKKKRNDDVPQLKMQMKPKRASRSRKFSIEEVYCFQCNIQFKRPQSLKSHLIHLHGKLGQPKITIRF